MHTQTSSTDHWKIAADSTLMPLLGVRRLGLITDLDGTISHICETPEATVITPRNRQLLSTMVLMLPLVAAFSERSARDLQARIAIPGMVYVGNNGLERWQNGGRVLNENVRQYRKALASALDELRPYLTVGMWIEDKYATASVHYRLTPRPEEAGKSLEPLIKDIAAHHGLTAQDGHRLFDIRPPIEANRGTALSELVEEYELDGVIYLGDDHGDIAAMQMGRKLRELEQCQTIAVGVVSPDDTTEIGDLVREASDVFVNDVNDVEVFLAWLLDALTRKRV